MKQEITLNIHSLIVIGKEKSILSELTSFISPVSSTFTKASCRRKREDASSRANVRQMLIFTDRMERRFFNGIKSMIVRMRATTEHPRRTYVR